LNNEQKSNPYHFSYSCFSYSRLLFFTKFRVSTLSPELPQPTTQPASEVLTTPTPPTSQATPTTEVAPKEVIIKITANGFEPEEVEITKGTKVTWINEQPNPSWPASDVHPTHEVYPGSSIKNVALQNKIKFLMLAEDLNKEKVGALFLMKLVNGIIMII
jgi:plastocyanin